ncbi:MAG: ATP-binding cassette domain-containing protein [Betaproteobacteria bacterium]|nr:ATP-binding cassette domain-containing protein [Betaproteobacteria bacterium]
MSSPLISVSHVYKSVTDATGTLDILRDIDFTLMPKETIAIVGASGSGKSTLLSIMAGLDTPTRGTVHLADFQLLAPLTALENVMLPLELAGHVDPKPVAKDMLARVGLSERLNHYPKVMSGGEQQRVALARAFVVKPQVLLADEPTGSLDHATGETIMQLMLSLNQELGTTLVLVTHDLALSRRCDRRLVMEAGRASWQP